MLVWRTRLGPHFVPGGAMLIDNRRRRGLRPTLAPQVMTRQAWIRHAPSTTPACASAP